MAPGVFPENLRQIERETDFFLNQAKFVKKINKNKLNALY